MKRNGCPLRSPHPSHCLSLFPVTGLCLFSSQHLPQSAIIRLLVCLLSLDQHLPQCNSQVQSSGSLPPLTEPLINISASQSILRCHPFALPDGGFWWWKRLLNCQDGENHGGVVGGTGGLHGAVKVSEGEFSQGEEAPGKCRDQCRWIHWVKIRILQWMVGTLS